jgi:excinuclease ABC subunit C
MTRSALDGVAGLGEVRRKALLRHFGSVKRLASATVAEILEVPGIGRRTAEAILAALAPQAEPPQRPTAAAADPPPAEGAAQASPAPDAARGESPPPQPDEITPAT